MQDGEKALDWAEDEEQMEVVALLKATAPHSP
jgi:hypothetical protein